MPPVVHPDELEPGSVRPLRFAEYMQLADSGAFQDEHVELLDGAVVRMSPQGALHVQLQTLFMRVLGRRLPASHMLTASSTLQLSDYTAPEPDLAVVTSESVFAQAPRTVWVIEVAVSSQPRDHGIKRRLYGAAGIPEYWVIDAAEMEIVVYRQPHAHGYASRTRHPRAMAVAPAAFPDLEISLDALLADRVPLS